jgi:hypothetical protein
MVALNPNQKISVASLPDIAQIQTALQSDASEGVIAACN